MAEFAMMSREDRLMEAINEAARAKHALVAYLQGRSTPDRTPLVKEIEGNIEQLEEYRDGLEKALQGLYA